VSEVFNHKDMFDNLITIGCHVLSPLGGQLRLGKVVEFTAKKVRCELVNQTGEWRFCLSDLDNIVVVDNKDVMAFILKGKKG
jgi:hypothetical protein